MLAIFISFLTPVLGLPVATTDRPVPLVVERHNRHRPGVIVGAVVGSVVGAFIILFAVLWWKGKGCADKKRPVTPSPPESQRPSCHSERSHAHSHTIGRVVHEEGWHNLSNPTLPHSSPPSCKTGLVGGHEKGKEKEASAKSVHSTTSSPRKSERKLPYIKASSPPPPSPPPHESPWKIPRPRSVTSFRSASSSPVKEPYVRASSETARETRERRVSLQERQYHNLDSPDLSQREDLMADRGARKVSFNRTPSLSRKPSFTMMLKNNSKASLTGGYVTTQERLRDQDEEEETRDWTKGMKPLAVDHL